VPGRRSGTREPLEALGFEIEQLSTVWLASWRCRRVVVMSNSFRFVCVGAAISSGSRRREAALRQYQHCVDALKRELAEIWGLFTWAAA